MGYKNKKWGESKQYRKMHKRKFRGRGKKKRPATQVSIRTREIGFSAVPEAMWTKMIMNAQNLPVAEAVGTQFKSFYLNSFGDGSAGTNGCGPQTAFAGVYLTNYPVGNAYFLSNRSIAGHEAQSPYFNYVITHAKFMYRIMPQALALALSTPSAFIKTVSCPYQSAQAPTAVAIQTFSEQPQAMEVIWTNPVAATGLSPIVYTTQNPKWQVRRFNIAKLLGISRQTLLTNNTYWQNAGALGPAGGLYSVVIALGGDAANFYKCLLDVRVEYTVKYFNRNTALTSAANL